MQNRKTQVLVFIVVVVFMMSYGCDTSKFEDVIDFDDNVESIIVYTYDFEKTTTNINWAYKGESLKSISDYFSELQGVRLDELPLLNLNHVMYGIEINEKNAGESKTLLISGEYAITVDGEVFRIDASETEKICQSLTNKLKGFDFLIGIINLRAISLRDNKWINDYLVPSEFDHEASDKVMLISDEEITNKTNKFDYEVINNSDQRIEYGARVRLEVYLNGIWYQIDDVQKGNINLDWIDMLYMLEPNDKEKFTYHIKYYQPLPIGKYRILKEYSYSDGAEVKYMFSEFEIK